MGQGFFLLDWAGCPDFEIYLLSLVCWGQGKNLEFRQCFVAFSDFSWHTFVQSILEHHFLCFENECLLSRSQPWGQPELFPMEQWRPIDGKRLGLWVAKWHTSHPINIIQQSTLIRKSFVLRFCCILFLRTWMLAFPLIHGNQIARHFQLIMWFVHQISMIQRRRHVISVSIRQEHIPHISR